MSNRDFLKDLKVSAIRNLDIEIRGTHIFEKYWERIGVRNIRSLKRLLTKVVQNGEVITSSCKEVRFYYKNRVYPFVIDNDFFDGVKKLFPKTVLTMEHIVEERRYVRGKLCGRQCKKSDFRYTA